MPASILSLPIAEETKAPPRGRGRILVVDDELVIRELLTYMLDQLGYEATVASDGAEGLELFRQAHEEGSPYAAAILDLTIPGGMGGKEAAQKLREVDPTIKAIVSSGYSNDPIMNSFEKYGFAGVVKKPYTLQDLSQCLVDVLGPDA